MTSLPRRGCVAVAVLAVLSACGAPGSPSQPVFTASSAPPSAAPPSSPPSPPTASTPPTRTAPPTGSTPTSRGPAAPRVVVLDPGHNGGNAANPAQINKQVPAGRGKTKPCNTTGTATNAGYPEHAFTWDVAVRTRDALTARGVQVVMTRADDTGVGPCVDQRAAIGNQAGAAAVVSIHADGSTSPGAYGFHVAYSAPPLNAAQGEPSTRLASTVRDRLRTAGFATSTYIGTGGLSPRNDLAGLNLSERPAVLVECGNMRNAAEAATLSSPAGRQRYADAISDAVIAYLS